MNNITIELCQEDRIRIDALNKGLGIIAGLLEGINAANEKKGLIETVEVEEVIQEPHDSHKAYWDTVGLIKEEAPQEPAEAPQEVEEVQPLPITVTAQNEPTVTKQDIQQKVVALVGAGKKEAVRDIITTYAGSVSQLPDSTLNEVWDKLIALEG